VSVLLGGVQNMNNLFVYGLIIFWNYHLEPFGSLFLKKGSKDLHRNIFFIWKNYKLLFGILLFLFSSIFYIWALKYIELSLAYPITSLSYIWVSLLSLKFLGENMNKYKWVGILLIILGVILITR